MTVRIRRAMLEIDSQRLAAILTPALLSPIDDDAPSHKPSKIGTAWLRWGDAQRAPVKPQHLN